MLDAVPPARGTTAAPPAVRLGRLTPLLLLGQFAWALPGAASGTLLAALLAAADPAHKVGVFTAYSIAGAVTSAVGTVGGGLLSDRTRSRLGRRVPWLLGAALCAGAALAMTGLTRNLVAIGVLYALFQLGVGTWVAALSALVPDHVPAGYLGRVSAFSGFGYLLGQTVGGVVAGALVVAPRTGLVAVSWTMAGGALVIAFGLHGRGGRDDGEGDGEDDGEDDGEREGDGRSDRAVPRPAGRRPALRDLVPSGSRDFWLAFTGRFLFILAILMITVFQYYLFTDYLHLPTRKAGQEVGIATVLVGALSAVSVIVAGVISDRLQRMKPFVIGAPVLLALGVVPLLAAPSLTTSLFFYAAVGLTLGSYLCVDQALMVAVLPDAETAARDLGVLSIGSTLPAVAAPILGGVLASTLGYQAIFVAALVLAVAAAAAILGIRSVR